MSNRNAKRQKLESFTILQLPINYWWLIIEELKNDNDSKSIFRELRLTCKTIREIIDSYAIEIITPIEYLIDSIKKKSKWNTLSECSEYTITSHYNVSWDVLYSLPPTVKSLQLRGNNEEEKTFTLISPTTHFPLELESLYLCRFNIDYSLYIKNICQLSKLKKLVLPMYPHITVSDSDLSTLLLSKIKVYFGNNEIPDLHWCCLNNRIYLINLLLKIKKDYSNINYLADVGSPLHIACTINSLEIIKLLVNHGAQINKLNSDLNPPLYYLINRGDSNIEKSVEFLLQNNALVNLKLYGDTTLLHIVCEKIRHRKIMSLLIKYGADVNSVTIKGFSPLFITCDSRFLEGAKLLIENNADVNILNFMQDTCLHLICSETIENGIDYVKLLLSKNSNVNAQGYSDYTPLMLCATDGNTEIFLELLKYNADVNLENKMKKTVLFFLAESDDNYPLLLKIIGSIKNINHTDHTNSTALHMACKKKAVRMIELLVKCGIDVNIKDANHEPAIYYKMYDDGIESTLFLLEHTDSSAIGPSIVFSFLYSNNMSAIEMLLKKGIDINIRYHKETLLTYACKLNQPEYIHLLLKYGADVNIPNKHGRLSPFLLIIQMKYPKNMITTFIDHGADLNNNTPHPLHIAMNHASNDVIKLLLEKGCSMEKYPIIENIIKKDNLNLLFYIHPIYQINYHTIDNNRNTLLHIAVQNNTEYCIIAFLIKLIDVNCRNIENNTPLHMCNDLTIAQLLVNAGADVNAENIYQENPLFRSLHQSVSVLTIEYLIDKGSAINKLNSKGQTPIFTLLKYNMSSLIVMMFNAHAKMTILDKDNKSMIDYSIELRYDHITSYLLHTITEKSLKKLFSLHLLYYACINNRLSLVEKILKETPAYINQEFEGKTLLQTVSNGGHYNVVTILINHNADVNKTTHSTPLYPIELAMHHFYHDIVKALLKAGSKLLIDRPEDIKFQLDYIHTLIINSDEELIRLCVINGYDLNTPDSKLGRTVLHSLCKIGNVDKIKLILTMNANLNLYDLSGVLPIHLTNNLQIIQLFIEKGMNINSKNLRNGNTLLHMAFERGDPLVIQYLLKNGADINLFNDDIQTPLHCINKEKAEFILKSVFDIF